MDNTKATRKITLGQHVVVKATRKVGQVMGFTNTNAQCVVRHCKSTETRTYSMNDVRPADWNELKGA